MTMIIRALVSAAAKATDRCAAASARSRSSAAFAAALPSWINRAPSRSPASRSAIDAGDPAKVKDALRDTISLVDKMAGKKVIHRNAAARYKSRLAKRVSKRTSASA